MKVQRRNIEHSVVKLALLSFLVSVREIPQRDMPKRDQMNLKTNYYFQILQYGRRNIWCVNVPTLFVVSVSVLGFWNLSFNMKL